MHAASQAHPPHGRVEFLDWLRVIAIGFLLLFHTGMLFVGWGWHIESDTRAASLELPMDIAHRLRMPLLFVIAGASVLFMLRRRGVGEVLLERARRLLVPLFAGIVLVVPPQIWIERLERGQFAGGYPEFLLRAIATPQPYPQGDVSWHHLWFIAYLFVYCLALVPLFARLARRICPLAPGAWLYALALPLGLAEALLKPRFPETHALIGDWHTLSHYALFFGYGFLLCWMPRSWDWLMTRRRHSLALAAALTATILVLESLGILRDDTAADAITANLFTWSWLMVFLGYGRRWLSFENALLRYLRDASYPVYILHQTIIIAVAYPLIHVAMPWQASYLLVLGATVALSLALYELPIRRSRLLRPLFGLAPGRAVRAEAAHTASAQA